jgi:PAS domain S-box-containing protein
VSDPLQDQEAAHLRRLLETQPSCLIRVGVDGLLLAANEAALALFGTQELSEVVGHNLTERIDPNRGTEWQAFAARVWEAGPGSLECEINIVAGAPKSVLFQAVPLHDHPDQVRSLLLTARDVSGHRRLETALEHHDAVSPARDLRAELAQALAELDALRTERALAETSRTESEANRQRLAAAHAAEVARFAQALAELDALRTERALAETSRTESEANQQRLAAAHAAEIARLTRTLTEHHQLTTQLKNSADEARAEQQRIAALLEQRDAEREQRDAEQKQRDAEQTQRDAEQTQRDAEQTQRDAEQTQRDAEYARLAAQGLAEQARLQRALADEQSRAQALEREARELDEARTELDGVRTEFAAARTALDAARTEIAAALAEGMDLKTSLERRDTQYQRLVTEQAVERATLQRATEAERERAHGFEQQAKQLADGQTELQAALEASAADTADLKALLQQHENALKDLRSKLVNAAGERKRLDTLLKERDAEQRRLAVDHAAERADADKAREDAARKHADLAKSIANQKLELQILTENMRKVEPLAAAGRLAAEVHGELQGFLAQIEQRAGRLIDRCSLEAIDRHEIEGLRIDTARAASLARQVVPPKADA